MEGATFSSATSRERDKRIEDKHKKEIEALERKIENLRRTNDQTRKELWEARQGAQRLANCLGYHDISEVQQDLDMMPEDFNFKASIDRLQALEKEAEDSKGDVEVYAQQLEEVERKINEYQAKAAEKSKSNAILARDNAHLREQYAALELKFRRATDRYKQDYQKWRDFHVYLTKEDKIYREQRNQVDVTPAQKGQLGQNNAHNQLEYLRQKGPNLEWVEEGDVPPFGGTELPEDLATPELNPSDLALAGSSAKTLVVANEEVVASSDTEEESVVEVTPMPRRTAPAAIAPRPLDRLKQKQFVPPSASPTLFISKQEIDVAPSSETEEASDLSSPQRPPVTRPPAPRLGKEAAAASSETEEESIPVVIDLSRSSDTEESGPLEAPIPLAISVSANVQRRPADRLFISERPTKMRKLSNEGDADNATPRKRDENSQPQDLLPKTDPGKGTKRHSDPAALRVPGTTVDYSIFKGKGRYGRKSDAGPSTSVNARFIIDAEKNGGRDYRFDEVVRGRDERKKMHAGTCECCNDYYEAVGPLPPRLQPPLWRSPPKKKCQSLDEFDDTPSSSRRQQEIESHKKNISRHRHNWERAKTPPDYWNIGFPSTQEAGEINERAEKMHQEKLEEIEREVASGTGRYKRRSYDTQPLRDTSTSPLKKRTPNTTGHFMTPVRRIFFRLEWSKSSKKRKGTMVKQPKPSTSQGTLGSISEQSHLDTMMTSPLRTPERSHPFRTQRGTFTSSGDRVYPPMLARIATTSASTTATPLRRPARLAIQQEDPSFDAVVVTTLPNYPFCCHEDLLSMSREGLFSVARMLNGRLPMTSQIPVGEWVPETVVRERIEVLVGIRPPVPMAPKAVKCAQTLSVAMDVDVEDGDGDEDSREGILSSPPSSPLALREKRRGSTRLAVLPSRVPRRRGYVQGSNGLNEGQAMNVIEDICISPRRFLEPLDEESEPSSEGGATARRYEDSDTDASIASSDPLDEHSAKRRKVSDDGRYARVFSKRASFGPRSPGALGSPSKSPLQQDQPHQLPLQFKFSVRRKPVMQAFDDLGVKAAPSPSMMVSTSDSIDMLFNGGPMSPSASHLAN